MSARGPWLIVLALGAACSSEGPGASSTTVRDSAGVRITSTDARRVEEADDFAAVVDTIALVGSATDGSGSEALFQVAAARFLSDGRLVVLQGGTELLFLDGDGSRLAAVGRRGEGPGEYALATGLRLTSAGELAVWDAALARLSILSESGAFVRSRQLDLEAVAAAYPIVLQIRPESRWALLDEDRLLAFDYAFDAMPEAAPSRPRVTFIVVQTQMEELTADTLGEYGGVEQTRLPRSGGRAVPTLDPEDTYYAVAEGTGHIYVGDSGSSRIDRFDSSGALDLRIELRNVDDTPDARRLAEAQARLVERLERSGLEGMAGPVAEMAADEDAPAFRALAADDENRLWVRWGQQTESPGVRYVVFDPLGMPVGTILLPPHERILAISAGRVLLLHRSPLGVETLGVYAVGA